MRLKRLSTEARIRDDVRPSGGKAVGDFDQGRDAMNPTSSVQQRLEEARSLAEILTAAYDAFDAMLSAFDRYHNGPGAFYPALVMAGPAAAGGRNTIGMGPSLPPPERDRPWPPEPANEPTAQEVAGSVAALAALTARKLRIAAGAATSAADCSACVDAAQYADEVRGLMTGTGP
jgi:hypothetical protein